SCKGWSRASTLAMSASACANSPGYRRAFRPPTGQGAEQTRIDPSPSAGPSERQSGRTRRPGDILRASASSRAASLRRRQPSACCARDRPQAPGSPIDGHGAVTHVDVRGPAYKGSLTGGTKSLFRLPPNESPRPRLVLAEAAIDALSLAAIEGLRPDTLYAATGGGIGPDTIAALEALLTSVAMLPGALLISATDANGPGDRFAERHRSLAEQFAIPFARLRPPIEGGDWNDA